MAEQGLMPPVSIFPEGATTNGKSLLEFKRGAFFSLGSIKPHYTKFWTLTGSEIAPTDGISLVWYCVQILCAGIVTMTLNEMPVFKPNDFFWKNHWDGKEEKWIAYCRAVRTIMAENAGMTMSNTRLEDKVDFKNLVRGKAIIKRD